MSTRAILDTIRVELNQHKSMGVKVAAVSPGNYGLDFMKESFDFDLDRAVKCSNYIGETIDMARELGFKKVLLCGHIGKLIKLSGGIMNTHSREGDCRMELMAAAAVRCGAENRVLRQILDCVSTEEAVDIYIREKIDRPCFEYIMERIHFFLSKRAGDGLLCECIMYSGKQGLLGETDLAREFIAQAKGELQW
jgi:cobalt-precorrin-5B (C1)-methyltransferase